MSDATTRPSLVGIPHDFASPPGGPFVSRTRVNNEPVFRAIDYVIFGGLSLLTSAAILYLSATWIQFAGWRASPIAAALITLAVVFNLGVQQLRWYSLPLMRRPRPMSAAAHLRVGVATTVVPGSESLEMLADTVRALVRLGYPHETWVLDEADDARVKAVCERLGARHFSRSGMLQYQAPGGSFAARTKYGNYNAWLQEVGFARYDIVSIFDPDHVPEPEFLDRVLGYFDDPHVGYVQAPQAYYNQRASMIARGAAEETYSYYSTIQMANYAMGYPVVTGCHSTHRITALEQVGGLAAHHADDLLITLLYRAAGWRGVYVPTIVARGLTPVDWRGYLIQQRRWASSVLDVKFRAYPRLAGRLPWRERLLGLVHGIYYLRCLDTPLLLAALMLLLVGGELSDAMVWPILGAGLQLAVVLALTAAYRQRFFLAATEERGLHWRAWALEFAKWPIMMLAVGDAVRGGEAAYAITPKLGRGAWPPLLVVSHGLTALAVAAAWVLGALLGHAPPVVVQIWAAAVLLACSSLAVSALLQSPRAYDPHLRRGSAGSHSRDPGGPNANT